MVNLGSFPLHVLALGLVSSQHEALAAPATMTATTARSELAIAERFSFAEWVDSIIADPSTALSPEEAVQAFLDTANGTLPAAVEKRAWDAQVDCTIAGDDGAKVSLTLKHIFNTRK